MTIEVTDLNEAPEFAVETATWDIPEDTPAGQTIGSPLTATDEDTDATLTYTLDPAAGVFAIDSTSGQVRTTAELDHEVQQTYRVTVTATDNAELPATDSIDVTIDVTDAPGMVSLLPTPPQVGTALTATLTEDPDDLASSAFTWWWERSADQSTWQEISTGTSPGSSSASEATFTYTPRATDLGDYLRATIGYTDRQGTSKTVAAVTGSSVVARRRPPPPPPPPGPGPGPGGGGGPACAEDLHGNTSTQATAMALSAVTAGAICPAADVDYFTVTAPRARTGLCGYYRRSANPREPSGRTTRSWRPAPRAGSRTTGWEPVCRPAQSWSPYKVKAERRGRMPSSITFVRGYLENPGPESFQSGVGVLSGWVCAAEVVEIELNGVPQEAAYGTERLDTAGVCGDVDNGFGLLVNWNRLGEGEHTVVAYVDGVELGRATVTVTTLGHEFLRDVAGTCEVEDFPALGETVTLMWQQTSQNFVIAGGSAPAGATPGRTSTLTGFLENPGHNSFQSGVRVLSGWVCEADMVEIEIGSAGRQVAAYGTERLDTLDACGDTDNGFGLLFNWNLLGDGEHEVVAFVDGIELGRATVRVTTVGEGAEEEFLRGVEGECVVEDFPHLGETVRLEWQQNNQNFVITEVE